MLRGLTIRDLRLQFGRALPPEITQGLRDIYQLAQAMHEKTGFNLDINATNLVWIDDQAAMSSLHMKKPGFALYEMSKHLSDRYIEKNMSFDEYLQEFSIASDYEVKKAN